MKLTGKECLEILKMAVNEYIKSEHYKSYVEERYHHEYGKGGELIPKVNSRRHEELCGEELLRILKESF